MMIGYTADMIRAEIAERHASVRRQVAEQRQVRQVRRTVMAHHEGSVGRVPAHRGRVTRSPRRTRPPALRPGLILGLVTVVLVLGRAMVVVGFGRSTAASTPALDPRIVITPQTLAVQARLGGGVRLSGLLTPAIPGANMLHLTARSGAGAILSGGSFHLRTTMLGMPMPPLSATLTPQHNGYAGVLALPMFGRYRATVHANLSTGSYSGTVTFALVPPPTMTGR